MLYNRIVIRLKRKRKCYNYDIVVVSAKRRTRYYGAFLERIGYFVRGREQNFYFGINFNRLAYWLNRGAIMRNSFVVLLLKFISVK